MKTSRELKEFVDRHGLYLPDFFWKNSEEKYNFVSSLLRTGETVSFIIVCNGVIIKKDKKTIASYFGSGYFNSGGILAFTNKRLIVTDYSVPKGEPKYHTFQWSKVSGEQNWDMVEIKGSALQHNQVVIRFDDGAEVVLSIKNKTGKHVIDELTKYLSASE